MPADLAGLVRAWRRVVRRVVKLAVTPTRLTDQLSFPDASCGCRRHAGGADRDGHRQVCPRASWPQHVGSCWTYGGAAIAPGQVTPELMRVAVSRRAAHGRDAGLRRRRTADQPFVVADAAQRRLAGPRRRRRLPAVRGAGHRRPAGHRRRASTCAASASRRRSSSMRWRAPSTADPLARRLGAANTLTRTAEGWVARNTDVEGFLHPLRSRLTLAGARASVLGARWRRSGGRRRPARRRCSRHRSRASSRPGRVAGARWARRWGSGHPPPGTWDLLVNTTPVGTAPHVEDTPLERGAARRRRARLRPGLQPRPDPPAARRRRGRLRDARRSRDADCPGGGAGRHLVPRRASRRGDARCHPRRGAATGAGDLMSAMTQTTFDEFVDLARRGTFVPVCRELLADLLTPVSAFLRVAEHSDYAFLFESVEGGEQVARYSFLGKDPFLVLRARDGKAVIEQGGQTAALDETLRRGAAPHHGRVPLAIRPRAAAIHGRRRRVLRLRRGAVVRAGPAGRVAEVRGPAGPARRSGVHALRHGARVRPRQAPDPAHRQRPHLAVRRPGIAVPVRQRAARLPATGTRTGARAADCQRRPGAGAAGRPRAHQPRRTSNATSARRRSTSPGATSTRWCCRNASRSTCRPTRSPCIARCAT